MNKTEFMRQLATELVNAQVRDADNTLDYYAELIADRLEAGQAEPEIIASLEQPAQIVRQLKAESNEIPQHQPRSKAMLALLILLLILGCPLWGSLLLVAVLLIAIGYALIWLIPILAAVFTASGLIGGAVSLLLSLLVVLQQGWLIGLMQLGISLVMLGVGLLAGGLAWYTAKYLMRWSLKLTHWLFGWFSLKTKVVG